MQDKKEVEYTKPAIEDYGDLAELTAAQITGTVFDVVLTNPLPLLHHSPS